MRISHTRILSVALLLAALGLTPLFVPRFAGVAHAQTSIGSLQCGSGGMVSLAPTGLATSATPVGTSAATAATPPTPVAGLSCAPVSSVVASVLGATATVTACGVVTSYSSSSITVNNVAVSIPSGVTLPGYVALGRTVIVSFLIPGGQLVEVSPGFCLPVGSVVITTSMTGAAEIPTGDPHGSGTAVFTFNASQGTVCFTINVAGIKLPAIAAHIHKAPAGTEGPVLIPLTAPDASGNASGCVNADPGLIGDIIAHPANYYVNVHTTDFPGGAVRGQLG